MKTSIICGDSLEVMKAMADHSVEAIVCDPPYGLKFMNRAWDHGVPGPAYWKEALRVVKPGGYLLAFGGTRMFHRLMVAIEDADWELRDTISGENVVLRWIYGSGFPKNHDISKGIDAEMHKRWLKANPDQAERRKRLLSWASKKAEKDKADGRRWRKRIERGFRKLSGTERKVIGTARGVAGENLNDITNDRDDIRTFDDEGGRGAGAYGTGAKQVSVEIPVTAPATPEAKEADGFGTAKKPSWEPIVVARAPFKGTVSQNFMKYGTGGLNIDGCRVGGRWPANVVMCHMPECEDGACISDCPVRGLDEQSGVSRSAGGRIGNAGGGSVPNLPVGQHRKGDLGFGDSGGASRFFYTAKAPKSEREMGLHGRRRRNVNDGRKTSIDNPYQRGATQRLNTHTTVKPIAIMRWLVRLVTPKGGTVLDPFCGSGTTGIACKFEGMNFVGIDLEPDHVEIAKKRIAQASIDTGSATAEDAEEVGGIVQLGLFG